MRFICFLLSLCMLFGASSMAATADGVEIPALILYTCYRSGGNVCAGCVDEKGGIWLLNAQETELDWPDSASEQLSRISSCGLLMRQGRLNDSDLLDMLSLVSAVSDQGGGEYLLSSVSGNEYSYVVRNREGWAPVPVLLGVSGDIIFENTDPNAQALYLSLRNLFPQVTTFAYSGSGPQGFRALPVRSFCGLDGVSLESASVTASSLSGMSSMPMELSAEEQNRILSLVLSGSVTGKANASYVTGTSVLYTFLDEGGSTLGSVELCNGLLVRPDGMYYVS